MPAPRAAIFTRVAIYNRISNDPQGIEAGVERQREDCLALADRLGWQVCETYVDNDLSAWTGKPRPDYRRMLADIRAGKVDAPGAPRTRAAHRPPCSPSGVAGGR